MRIRAAHRVLCSAATALVLAGSARAEDAPEPAAPTAKEWGALREPGPGPARAIGRYGGGCLDGAVRIAERGAGYYLTRPERGRSWGHPTLVALLEGIGRRLAKARLPALPLGDLGQARGGPAPSGHASHQTGLDVDVWFEPLRPDGTAVSLVDLEHKRPTSRFGPRLAQVLALVAGEAAVDRLFVNPVLKQALCARVTGPRDWLRKVRPWWGHHDHFHVRLACPPDSPACEAQEPLPPGDGCGELASWLDGRREKDRKGYQARVGATPPLPAPCLALVGGNGEGLAQEPPIQRR